MQLRSAVLPAPFGPMRAVIFPFSASRRTFCRTCNPPKLSETCSISRIRSIRLMPSANAAILLDVAIAAFARFLLTEIEFLHIAVLEQLLARAGKHDPAVFEDVAVVGN